MKKAELDEERKLHTERIALLVGLDPLGPSYLAAITHPSYAHERPGVPDNQRLEFLGDAILDFVVSEDLYREYAEFDEGQLTRLRAQLVNTEALSRFARHHELGSAIRFGKGAAQGSLHDSENVLADAVEALIAAAYLDFGIEGARRVCRLIVDFGMKFNAQPESLDTKSELQERVQALGLKAPVYRVVATQGKAHEMIFEVEVSVNGRALAQGRGRSKRLAERAAAAQALNEQGYEQLVIRATAEQTDA